MFERGAELRFGVRPWVVLKYRAQLSLVFAILVAVPLVVSLALGERAVALRYAAVIAALVVLGLFSRGREPTHVQVNEGLVIVALAFLGAAVLMASPLTGYELGLEDTIIPARTISRQLEDMVEGLDSVERSTVLEGEDGLSLRRRRERHARATPIHRGQGGHEFDVKRIE